MIVGRKKKDVLVAELRERKYEAFPPNSDAKKKSAEDEMNKSDDESEEVADSGGARDYDYLLSVRLTLETPPR